MMVNAAKTIQIPVSVDEQEARLYLALKLFELGKLSLGQAAKYSGNSIRSFIEILGRHGIPVLNQKTEELESDVKNAAHRGV